MEVFTDLAPMDCPDCGGTGRCGSIGGYRLVCRLCSGKGQRLLTFGHVRTETDRNAQGEDREQ